MIRLNTHKTKVLLLVCSSILVFYCTSYSQTVSSNRFKRIDYEYDLVSGKVNKVSYQKDSADQFIHQYSYDSDNRITKVETSSDNVVWDVDAKYFYYAHGSLARTEIGNDKVQGIDYAYTLQGWIKGVNSNTLDKKRDMGQDGKDTSIYDPSNPQLHANFAQDAFGYSLNYFKGDYKAISQVRWNNATNRFEAVTPGSDLMASRHDLHNGNISSMVTTIVKPTITPGDTMQFVPLPQGTAYKYDQLNRLVEMKAWQNLNSTNNTWGTGLTYNGMYNNKFSYDANGNILTQLRKDASGTAINDLSYNRYNLAGKTMQNRLYMVDDAIGNTAFTDDIDDQGTFDNSTYNNVRTNNNYGYDEIGNMNRNNQKEIAQIKYTVYGKVKEVIRTSGSSKKNLKFDYDPTGNRIAKHVYNSSNVWEKTEYYVLDAQGNTMSVYKHEATGATPPISFAQIERNIYGSSRIGVDKTHKELIGAFASTSLTHVTGNKQYDGVNHLGNVLVSFTDKRLPIDADNNSVIDGYWPEVVSANDYYPFGVKMKERSFASANNRFGFNGQEKEKEIAEDESINSFEFRISDGDIANFWTIDPLTKKYPELTPYQFANNTPVWAKELEGLEANYTSEQTETPFGGETVPTGTQSQFSGPRSESFMEENKLVEGSTKGSEIGLKSSIDVFVGRSGITGGKLGGHAIINLEEQGAYSFSNETKKDEGGTEEDGNNHLFAKSGEKTNSIFKNYSPTKYFDIKYNSKKELVSFNIDLTLDQRQSIIDSYSGKPSVDYSITGWRCASYCLKTLNNLNIVEVSDFKAKYIHAVTPSAFIKYLDSKGFKSVIIPGDSSIDWNNPLSK